MESPQELDGLISRLLPIVPVPRDAAGFLFDPAVLEGPGTVRDYYLAYLKWLDIPADTLPPERVYIHAGRPCPANLEFRQGPSGPGIYSLYIDAAVYRSPDALKMTLAHELTHLYLMVNGHQGISRTRLGTGSLSLGEEIRTEVASVLLGFGKLVLNGVSDFAQLYARMGYIGQLGYLPVPSFAYLYRRVNEWVGVPAHIAGEGLNSAARCALASGQ